MTDLLLEDLRLLDFSLDDEIECDYRDAHNHARPHHSGPGVWYIDWICHKCGDTRTLIVCDPFKDYMTREGLMKCGECGKTVETITGVRKVDKR